MNSNAAGLSSRRSPVALAAVLGLALASGTAWAIGGGHGGGFGGGHGGGFAGGRGGGMARGGQGPHLHQGPAARPYLYTPYYGYGFYGPGYPYSEYCDLYSPYYKPQYCS